MASAALELFPDAKFAVGPPTEDGFYYDFWVERPFTPEALELIEGRMREAIARDAPFEMSELTREAALERFADQPFKLEIIGEIPEGEAITTYTHDGFVDLCRGPHVGSTGEVAAFKLMSVAGAYWRGDERNEMLQRIYGTAWESEERLQERLAQLEEAARRDHRKLGQELGLFFFNAAAPASPFFLPKGAALYNKLVEHVRGLYARYGYEEVITPQMLDSELWKRSGHYDHYKENMYFSYVDEREFGVKPMNCPAAAMLYAAGLRSYRELPLRYADFGRLHRFERSGVTHGLTRVRTFSQDDAHIFCAPEQVEGEITRFIEMVQETYELFGFEDVRVALSLRPENRIGSDELWDRAEGSLAAALDARGMEYEPLANEGAFYGPKIDFFVADAIGREWQLGTVQLDYNMPERFDLEYVDGEGARQRPVVIHRAMLGSLERFLGVAIEHFGGAFPTWLAPVQAEIIPIADRHNAYAERVRGELEGWGVRVHVDDRGERMNAKTRDAENMQVPVMLLVGDKEEAEERVAMRLRSGERWPMSIDKAGEIISFREPYRISERLFLYDWHRPDDRHYEWPEGYGIRIDLARAFGTGRHPTTKRTLELLDGRIEAGKSALDVGSGSGILSIAAAKLGAGRVDAYEKDRAAFEAGRKNLRRNDVSGRVNLHKAEWPAGDVSSEWDIILANLDDDKELARIAPDLRRALGPGGCLIASGIRDVERMEKEFAAAGISVREKFDVEEEWATFVCD